MYSRKWQFNLVVAITTFLFAAISNAHEAPKSEREPQQEQNYPGGDFILQSPDGQLSLQDLHGKVVLLFFGFTSCADVCPTALAVISRVFSMMSPVDLEKQFGLTEGNLNHGEMTLDQFFFMRPTISAAQYKSPLQNLYICGPGTHPGGGLHGTNGFNAAQEILKESKS